MNTMTRMENIVMNMTDCSRGIANSVANAILDLDRSTETEMEREQRNKIEKLKLRLNSIYGIPVETLK